MRKLNFHIHDEDSTALAQFDRPMDGVPSNDLHALTGLLLQLMFTASIRHYAVQHLYQHLTAATNVSKQYNKFLVENFSFNIFICK